MPDNRTANNPNQPRQVPLLDLPRQQAELSAEIDEALKRVTSGASYILGPEVKMLEQQLGAYLGGVHCTGVASGTDALVIALRALAIVRTGKEYFCPDDEIIVPSFTFTATGEAVIHAGATPVFVDIDPVTYNIKPEEAAAAMTSRTVGLVPVHLFGNPCPMDAIMDLARRHDLFVLEDAAQSFGASFGAAKLGAVGTAGAFSFFPSKNLGGFGDGGAVATREEDLAAVIRMLRTHGGKDKYNVEHIGYNSRLDTLQAAVLLVKLKHVDRLNRRRRAIASYYDQHLRGLDWLALPSAVAGGEHVYNQYTVRVLNGKRDRVREMLREKGIATAVYYPLPLHRMKVFAGRCKTAGSLEQTEKACAEVLSLPIEPLLTEEELEYVVQCLRAL